MYPYDFYEMPDDELDDELNDEVYDRQLPPGRPPFGFPGGGFGPGGPGAGFGPGGPGGGFGPGGPGGGFGPGGPGGGFGPGGPSGAPIGPPPSFTPSQSQAQILGGVGIQAVDPGSIRNCLFRFTYIWPRNGRPFWAFPTFVGRRSIAGFRWMGPRRGWVYFGLDLRRINSFVCY